MKNPIKKKIMNEKRAFSFIHLMNNRSSLNECIYYTNNKFDQRLKLL